MSRLDRIAARVRPESAFTADIDRHIEQLIAECERNGIDPEPIIAQTLNSVITPSDKCCRSEIVDVPLDSVPMTTC